MGFERRKRNHRHVNVTPLVDVVFNLLLFFVITYNVAADPAIQVRLPESSTADTYADEPVVITVNTEGVITLDELSVNIMEIAGLLRQRIKMTGSTSVRIKADQDVLVGLLVTVVDEVKQSGCMAFSIVTARKPGT